MTFDLLAAVRCQPANPDYVPKEYFSPTAITLYRQCPSAWARRYLEGRREREFTWEEVRDLPMPEKPKKGWSAVARAEAEERKKAWNKIRRPAFGKAGHKFLERWYAGEEVDWGSDVGKVVWSGVHLLPDPATPGLTVLSEQAIEIKAPSWTRAGAYRPEEWPNLTGNRDHLAIAERLDYEFGSIREVTLRDYKFTSSFDWAKTPEEMREDPQVGLYSYDVIDRYGLDSLPVEWIYFRNDPEKSPAARAVRIEVTRAEAEAHTLDLAATALEMRDVMRDYVARRLPIIDIPKNVSHCPSYGGCAMHTSKGGPCDAVTSPGKALRQHQELEAMKAARKKQAKEQDMIDFKAAREKRNAEQGKAPPPADTKAADTAAPTDAALAGKVAEALTGAESVLRVEAESPPVVDAPAVIAASQTTVAPALAEASAAASEATAKLRQSKAASKAPKAAPADVPALEGVAGVTVQLAGGLVSLTVPLDTPLGAQLAKAAAAHAAYQAALRGE